MSLDEQLSTGSYGLQTTSEEHTQQQQQTHHASSNSFHNLYAQSSANGGSSSDSSVSSSSSRQQQQQQQRFVPEVRLTDEIDISDIMESDDDDDDDGSNRHTPTSADAQPFKQQQQQQQQQQPTPSPTAPEAKAEPVANPAASAPAAAVHPISPPAPQIQPDVVISPVASAPSIAARVSPSPDSPQESPRAAVTTTTLVIGTNDTEADSAVSSAMNSPLTEALMSPTTPHAAEHELFRSTAPEPASAAASFSSPPKPSSLLNLSHLQQPASSSSASVSRRVSFQSSPPSLPAVRAAATAGFAPAYASALEALTTLQESISFEVAQSAMEVAREQSAFESQSAEMLGQLTAAERELEALDSQRMSSLEQVESLRDALQGQRADLRQLTANHERLQSTHATLSAARIKRLTADYLRAQPVHVLLRHSHGSRRGDHRRFLKAYRAEVKAKLRLNHHDNIHDSEEEEDEPSPEDHPQPASDEEDEEEEAAGAAAAAAAAGVNSLAASSSPAAAASPLSPSAELPSDSLPSDPSLTFDAAGAPIMPRRYGTFIKRGPLGSVRLALPRPILDHIFTHLGVRDLQGILCVCRGWHALLQEKTAVWKGLLQRVSGVELRLKREKEKERISQRGGGRPQQPPPQQVQPSSSAAATAPTASQPIVRSNGQQHHLAPDHSPANSLPRSDSASMIPAVDPASSSPGSTPPLSRKNSSVYGSSAPGLTPTGTPTPSTPGKAGLLGNMLRRFQRGSATNLHTGVPSTPSSSAASSSSHGASSSDDFSSSSLHSCHLHYALTIDLPSRDSYVLTVAGSVARSIASPDGGAHRCGSEIESESEKGLHSLTLHICSLRGRGSMLQEELDFCIQLYALQASLTQAKLEKARVLATMDSDEGIKKALTSETREISARISAVEAESERIRQQSQSDRMTQQLLAQQLTHMQTALAEEQARTAAAERERNDKLHAASREAAALEAARQQQLELHAQLKTQKRQLTKEVKSMQVQLEKERNEKRAAQEEWEQLTATLAAIKRVV